MRALLTLFNVLILLTKLTDSIAQSLPGRSFFRINVIGCYQIFKFNKTTFEEKEGCDMGRTSGSGAYKYFPKDSLLILYYDEHLPDSPRYTYSWLGDSLKMNKVVLTLREKKSKETLPFSYVFLKRSGIGRYTNDMGAVMFELPDSVLSDTLRILVQRSIPVDINLDFRKGSMQEIAFDLEVENRYKSGFTDTLYIKYASHRRLDMKHKDDNSFYTYYHRHKYRKFIKKHYKKHRPRFKDIITFIFRHKLPGATTISGNKK